MTSNLLLSLSLPADVHQEYEFKVCGKKFGDSLGDMKQAAKGRFSVLKGASDITLLTS